ncbi:hypothetical protein [Actinoplanes philippinensis]
MTVVRYIAPTGVLARMPADDLARHLGRVLRQILFA